MVRVNLANGKTHTFNLTTDAGASWWARLAADPGLQGQIRGSVLSRSDLAVAVPPPIGFDKAVYAAEIVRDRDGNVVGERLTLLADEVQIDVLLYDRTPMARVSIRRVGRPRHLAQFLDER